MTAFIVILHILVSFVLILFVLLQPGARGGVGAAFGGAGGATVFGGRGANTFLAKLTAAAAVIFMLTSIGLSYVASHGSSVMEKRKSAVTTTSDKAPAKEDAAKGDAAKADGTAARGATGDATKAVDDAKPVEAAPAPVSPAPTAIPSEKATPAH